MTDPTPDAVSRGSAPPFHRYTITSEGASPGYFRLVEDPKGMWIAWAEIEAYFNVRASVPPARVWALAREQAYTNHRRVVWWEAFQGHAMCGIKQDFDVCPHPDCAAVRAGISSER